MQLGQEGVSSAKILVVGAGGLGCPVAMYLAGAGVNTLGIVDYDELPSVGFSCEHQRKHGEIGFAKSKVYDKCTAESSAMKGSIFIVELSVWKISLKYLLQILANIATFMLI
ncbi:ThiF family protein [Oesophagostomum dentatum]|uniref:ThiF family protein n=1 Tax=Oesophagostomum dentatum TaxID=61180 RepID=A0A0B1TFU1_OESDE|nr:ThiF family protein [Oesophagostomum dentatum]